MDLDSIIKQNKEEMIKNLKKLVSYKSIASDPQENAPFGIENAKCLKEALQMAEKYEFRTKNLDNYCGYAEIGEGDKIIGIAGHLDVVPEGNGWKTDPFCATIKENKIYGRGVSDDKGAVVASMLALKIIKDLNIPLNKRIRLIMGCAEETGSDCMKYYVEKEGHFDIGFTPDGTFPCIYGEKGHIRARFKSANTSILDIKGGTVDNAVCDKCTIEIKRDTYSKELLENYFNNNDITFDIKEENDLDIIEVNGIAAHASRPHLGKSAITYLMKGLKESGYVDEFVDYYCERFDFLNDGSGFGIKCSDEYGELTCVNGKIYMENETIIGSLDIRVPVTLESNDIVKKLNAIGDKRANIEIIKFTVSTYFPIDSEIVQKLLKVYQEVTGDRKNMPITMGGGTYAKTLKNCIAFGCGFPNVNNKIHEANEYVDIKELMLQVKLYVHAILELLK